MPYLVYWFHGRIMNFINKHSALITLIAMFSICVHAGPPSWKKNKCGRGPKNKNYDYTDQQQVPLFANHEKEAKDDNSWIQKANYYANVRNCPAYSGIKTEIRGWYDRADYHMKIINKWGGLTDGGLRRHHATCLSRIKSVLADLGREHFGETVSSTNLNVNNNANLTTEYGGTKVFNYKDYCQLADIPGYKPPQRSSNTTMVVTNTPTRNPRNSRTPTRKKLSYTCPATIRVTPTSPLSGNPKTNNNPLNFSRIKEKKSGNKFEYHCLYTSDKIRFIKYTSNKKCSVRNSKIYCP